ncbi:hypothetical protein CCAX7_11990 [Capsulimonas corticalis]|uniref:Uncharacterized protein n=1 Tax=Capsulimonas corticalis TaxID=2219043 RepID=A0A402D4E8_9BACT|nr:hypothetical protein [Capsulimonas corticalis]BDI29148.1 hypothetical protein CCAX7_11990 [Capsulimonas corticalis]
MGARVDKAMAEVRKVFGRRPKPGTIWYCPQCYREDEVKAFIARPVNTLSEDDLRPIFWNGCTCFGRWNEIAYYVPRLLEVAQHNCGSLALGLPKLFLVAARVKLNNMLMFPEEMETEMDDVARTALFHLGQAILEDDLDETDEDSSWSLLKALSFLTAFDAPIEPLLSRLEQSERFSTRASFRILIAKLAAGTETFDDFLVSNWSMAPENQSVFDQLLAPTNALKMLIDHVDEIVERWPESEEELNQAFDRLAL